ncbi:MAG: putative beta-lysine N-acetyltransferase [Bacteroidales bacterium]
MDPDRLLHQDDQALGALGNVMKEDRGEKKAGPVPWENLTVRILESTDVEQITEIYREVFLSYPFPIHNPGYILKTMKENIRYFGVEEHGKLLAVSSAETDAKEQNAEMTDFATRPEARGRGMAQALLRRMETSMKKEGFKTLYTIARLKSVPMNKTFLFLDYHYAGTLIQNTQIAGEIESMNVFYKHL